MSEKTKDKETAEAVTGEPVSADTGDTEPETEQPGETAERKEEADAVPVGKLEDKAPPPPPAAPRRGTSPVSWLALFLSLLALAAAVLLVGLVHQFLLPAQHAVDQPVWLPHLGIEHGGRGQQVSRRSFVSTCTGPTQKMNGHDRQREPQQ